MRNILKGIALVIAFLLIMAGMILCMCETPTLRQQISNMMYGAISIVVGIAIGYLGHTKDSLESD